MDLNQSVADACELLTKFVVPLYADEGGRPALIGSGIFVRHEETNFLISAAHVLENLRVRHVYYYVSPSTTRKITGRLTMNVHAGSRDSDPLDLGAVQLEGVAQPPYPEVNKFSLSSTMLGSGRPASTTTRYAIIGYPASRSRIRRPADLIAEPYAYLAYSVEDEQYLREGLNRATHLCLSFDKKRSFDLFGQGRSFPKPHGVSGSPMFVIYDTKELEEERPFTLAGIVTTWVPHRKKIYGAGASTIQDMLRAAA